MGGGSLLTRPNAEVMGGRDLLTSTTIEVTGGGVAFSPAVKL